MAERATCPRCGGTKQVFTGNYDFNDNPIMDECNLCDANGQVDVKVLREPDGEGSETE